MPGDVHDAPPGSTCYGTLEQICLATAPQPVLQLDTSIVTTNDARCASEVAGRCVLYAQSIMVGGSVQVTGTRPLVLIATHDLTVNGSGVLDASSTDVILGAAANDASCTSPAPPEDGNGLLGPTGNSGGGGAGGTFGAQGASAGTGSTFTTSKAGSQAPAVVPINTLRGGCPGGTGGKGGSNAGGGGGASGGALYLVGGVPGSQVTIQIDGKVFASGAKGRGGAGNSTGGGGGGTGGLIALEADRISVSNGGIVAANGGGGAGGGGAAEAGGDGGNGTTTMFTMQASGGTAGDGDAATGGKGSTVGHLDGDPGANANYGGGGGGGGSVGIVWTKGQLQGTARFSPPPTIH